MEEYNLIKCQGCGIEIEPMGYCPNCFIQFDIIDPHNYPNEKIEMEAIRLFSYCYSFGLDKEMDRLYFKQTPTYMEWEVLFNEKIKRNKERVKMYRLEQDIIAAKNFLEKHGYIVQRKNEIIVNDNLNDSELRCKKCFNILEWGRIPCPDNDIGCTIIHNGYFCKKCKIIYNNNQKLLK